MEKFYNSFAPEFQNRRIYVHGGAWRTLAQDLASVSSVLVDEIELADTILSINVLSEEPPAPARNQNCWEKWILEKIPHQCTEKCLPLVIPAHLRTLLSNKEFLIVANGPEADTASSAISKMGGKVVTDTGADVIWLWNPPLHAETVRFQLKKYWKKSTPLLYTIGYVPDLIMRGENEAKKRHQLSKKFVKKCISDQKREGLDCKEDKGGETSFGGNTSAVPILSPLVYTGNQCEVPVVPDVVIRIASPSGPTDQERPVMDIPATAIEVGSDIETTSQMLKTLQAATKRIKKKTKALPKMRPVPSAPGSASRKRKVAQAKKRLLQTRLGCENNKMVYKAARKDDKLEKKDSLVKNCVDAATSTNDLNALTKLSEKNVGPSQPFETPNSPLYLIDKQVGTPMDNVDASTGTTGDNTPTTLTDQNVATTQTFETPNLSPHAPGVPTNKEEVPNRLPTPSKSGLAVDVQIHHSLLNLFGFLNLQVIQPTHFFQYAKDHDKARHATIFTGDDKDNRLLATGQISLENFRVSSTWCQDVKRAIYKMLQLFGFQPVVTSSSFLHVQSISFWLNRGNIENVLIGSVSVAKALESYYAKMYFYRELKDCINQLALLPIGLLKPAAGYFCNNHDKSVRCPCKELNFAGTMTRFWKTEHVCKNGTLLFCCSGDLKSQSFLAKHRGGKVLEKTVLSPLDFPKLDMRAEIAKWKESVPKVPCLPFYYCKSCLISYAGLKAGELISNGVISGVADIKCSTKCCSETSELYLLRTCLPTPKGTI